MVGEPRRESVPFCRVHLRAGLDSMAPPITEDAILDIFLVGGERLMQEYN